MRKLLKTKSIKSTEIVKLNTFTLHENFFAATKGFLMYQNDI